MKILIVGCGYLGTTLGVDLVKKGAEVWGLRRQWVSAPPQGITPLTADLLDPESLKNLPQADFIILCQAPKRETDSYQTTYLEATRNLIEYGVRPLWHLRGQTPLAPKGSDPKVILISSTSVYSTGDGSWVDETTPLDGGRFETKEAELNAKVLVETERLVLSSGVPSMVFRLGGIYGPGRHRLKALKEGKMKPSFSETTINRIRVEDIVAGVELLMAKGRPGEVYLGVDDSPSTQREFYEWIYEKTGWPHLSEKGPGPFLSKRGLAPFHGSNKRCSNAKLKALGWKPKYPSFKEGYAALFEEVA